MGAIARALPSPRARSLPPWRKLRRRLLFVLAAALALAAAYMLWLRDSDLVAVERVTVIGAEQNPKVVAALEAAGMEQSTLHVDLDELRAAVSGDPAVRSISADADFPSGLEISVDLRTPVGYVEQAGAVVAGDGVVLERRGSRPEGLATIEPATASGRGAGGELSGEALALSRVLGAAPEPLLAQLERVFADPDFGPVVEVGPGIELRFGDRSQLEGKWAAAAAVLADPKLKTAAYIDLSVPQRPVVGSSP